MPRIQRPLSKPIRHHTDKKANTLIIRRDLVAQYYSIQMQVYYDSINCEFRQLLVDNCFKYLRGEMVMLID